MILKRLPQLAASLMELQHGIVNRLTLNVLKTEYMLIGSRQIISEPCRSTWSIHKWDLFEKSWKQQMYCLGKAIDESPTWDTHVRSLSNKASSGTGVIIRVSLSLLPLNWLVSIGLLNHTWLLQRHTYGKWHQRPLQWQTWNGTKSCVSSQLPTNGYLRRNYCANLAGPISRRGERKKKLSWCLKVWMMRP